MWYIVELSAKEQQLMKKYIYIFLISVIVLIVGLTAYKIYADSQKPAAERKIERFGVLTASPERRTMTDVREFTGTLRADSSFALASKVGGRLQQITVSLGNPIEPGQLIAQIDDTEYLQAVEQSQADLAMGKAQVTEAEVALEQAKREYDRNERLRAGNVYSESQLETAYTTLQSKQAILSMRKAEVDKLQAILDNAETRLADTRVMAEWDSGTRYVGERFVDAGTLLAANESIITVIDIDKLIAEINVVERDYPKLTMGHETQITTDAYPGQIFTGNISYISQILNTTTRQAAVRIDIPNSDLKLKPGMFIRVKIEFGRRENVQAIPREAVVKRNDVTGVFMFNGATGQADFLPVETGVISESYIEILSPELRGRVITLGNHRLTDQAYVVDSDFDKHMQQDAAASKQAMNAEKQQ